MEANTRKLERIFDQTITYQIPLFQRPYVWTQEANWEPLWEDIQSLLDKRLRHEKAHPHFLGAVVLEQLSNPTGSIESRQVIDGQQRFTTLQLFLIAARDIAALHDNTKYVERFSDLVSNRRSKIDNDDEVFKVWPTNSNRAAFRVVHQAGSPGNIDKAVRQRPELSSGLNNIIDAYKFFYNQLSSWLDGTFDDLDEQSNAIPKTIEDHFDSLWHVIKDGLQVVVIDLDKNDETQVIFETLNATGEDLLPADLIKNFLFRWAASSDGKVEELYLNHWQKFETQWWRSEVKQGRITRPRIDVFINHYLSMMTREEVKSSHLFKAFKTFAENRESAVSSFLNVPTTAAEHIAQLSRYADIFRTFSDSPTHDRLSIFLRRLEALDTTTVLPFLLYIHAELVPERMVAFEEIVALLESYLIRRMLCNLTGKNYNRYFVDLIRVTDKASAVTATEIISYMRRSDADSTRFPDDREFQTAVTNLPLYGRLAQYKVRCVLEALDTFAHTAKSEVLPLPPGLTIEHVMPQTWQTHWHLAETDIVDSDTGLLDPLKEQKAAQRRERLINSLGNLTLITGSLNPALSNSSWRIKRPELLKFNKLNLTQYFHGPDAAEWDEDAIERRTAHLCNQILQIWPGLPSTPAA